MKAKMPGDILKRLDRVPTTVRFAQFEESQLPNSSAHHMSTQSSHHPNQINQIVERGLSIKSILPFRQVEIVDIYACHVLCPRNHLKCAARQEPTLDEMATDRVDLLSVYVCRNIISTS